MPYSSIPAKFIIFFPFIIKLFIQRLAIFCFDIIILFWISTSAMKLFFLDPYPASSLHRDPSPQACRDYHLFDPQLCSICRINVYGTYTDVLHLFTSLCPPPPLESRKQIRVGFFLQLYLLYRSKSCGQCQCKQMPWQYQIKYFTPQVCIVFWAIIHFKYSRNW